MPIPLNLTNIQGNCPGAFNKDFQSNNFLKFTGAAAGRDWSKEIAPQLSSGAEVIQFNNEFRDLKKQGVKKPEALISAIWVNVAISFAGLKTLNVKPTDLAAFPATFQNDMANANIGAASIFLRLRSAPCRGSATALSD